MTDGTTSGTTQLSHADAEALRGTAKWARFLAIVGFVMIGLMVILGLFAGSMMANFGSMMGGANAAQMEQMREMQEQMQGMEGMEGVDLSGLENYQNGMATAGAASGVMFTIMFLVIAALYFFPTLLLYQFATRTLKSLDGAMDAATLTSGLNSHRRFYKFMGILMIILLSIYALMFVFFGLFAAMM